MHIPPNAIDVMQNAILISLMQKVHIYISNCCIVIVFKVLYLICAKYNLKCI